MSGIRLPGRAFGGGADRHVGGKALGAPTLRRALALRPRQYQILQAVCDGRVLRRLDAGRLEPHLFQGVEVTRPLRGLAVRGLIRFRPIGPPEVTGRGRRVLNSAD